MKVTSFGTEYDLDFIASGRYNDRIGDKIVLICVDRKELMQFKSQKEVAEDSYLNDIHLTVRFRSLINTINPSDYVIIRIAAVTFFLYSPLGTILIQNLKID
jgi:hypothetical protein